jgi:micrococcal nuclease
MYEYKATVLKVIDGDTIDAEVDLGFRLKISDRFRLVGINAPETRTRNKEEKAKGLKSKKYVIEKIEGKEVIIKTEKKGKFGRYLATVYYIVGNKKINLNKELIKKGLATKY